MNQNYAEANGNDAKQQRRSSAPSGRLVSRQRAAGGYCGCAVSREDVSRVAPRTGSRARRGLEVGTSGHSDICSRTVKSRCLTLGNTQRDQSLRADASVVELFLPEPAGSDSAA
ncbi:hypothetical protein EYF80_046241 [Liparis tanakae]|uniref:Uncharacterized protein n=1 Tax=Liparis tanakae TaxID=230148 RepID=A0A4Z2FR05_9TELE|nr:hypothetical protein EYF80_046241 [Liparis tanakae]